MNDKTFKDNDVVLDKRIIDKLKQQNNDNINSLNEFINSLNNQEISNKYLFVVNHTFKSIKSSTDNLASYDGSCSTSCNSYKTCNSKSNCFCVMIGKVSSKPNVPESSA